MLNIYPIQPLLRVRRRMLDNQIARIGLVNLKGNHHVKATAIGPQSHMNYCLESSTNVTSCEERVWKVYTVVSASE